MNNIILEFLETYKSLDELCKQTLSSDKGISKYIEEMNYESQGHMRVVGWEKDYRQLKKMRWIRNRLVHETNSFEENIVNREDVEWLKNFRTRIMQCTDPFSLLYQSRNIKGKMIRHEECLENDFKTNEPSGNCKLKVGIIILIVIPAIICFAFGLIILNLFMS